MGYFFCFKVPLHLILKKISKYKKRGQNTNKNGYTFYFLTSVNAISQTKNSDSRFLFKKHLDIPMLSNSNIFWNTTKTSFQSNSATLILFEQQLLLPGKKIPNPWGIEKIKDTVNKRLVKGKMDAD